MSIFWVSVLAVPLVFIGFSGGVRSAWLFSAAAQLTAFAWWMVWRGPPIELFSCLMVFWVLPGFLGWMEREFYADGIRLTQEEASKTRRVGELVQEEKSCQSGIRLQDESTQEISQLYELSKEFLGTLEPEQGIRLGREFLGKWFPEMTESVREEALLRIEALMESGTLTAEGLAKILPVHSGGRENRERWAIAAEQLALGLQRLSLYRTVQESATHDGLTGLLVRRYFFQRLEDELGRAARRSAPVSFLMVDLDRFKTVNDTYGHLVGDVVLREVAQQIQRSVREMDLVGRYGGEEFEVVLPEADLELGLQIAERIRLAVEAAVIRAYDEEVRITVSIGVAVFPNDAGTPSDLIERADEALYRAKKSGRNQISAWSRP